MNQNAIVLNHLEKRPISSIEAINKYGITRLAARISDLKGMGHTITAVNVKSPSGRRHAVYRLVRGSEK